MPSRSLFHPPKLVLVERPCRLLSSRTKEIPHWELADPFLKRLLIYPWAMWYSCFVFVTAWFLMSSTAVIFPRGFVALRRPGIQQASLGGPCNRAVQSPGKDAGSRLTAIFSSFNMQPHPFPLPQIHRMLFRFITIRFRGCVWFWP